MGNAAGYRKVHHAPDTDSFGGDVIGRKHRGTPKKPGLQPIRSGIIAMKKWPRSAPPGFTAPQAAMIARSGPTTRPALNRAMFAPVKDDGAQIAVMWPETPLAASAVWNPQPAIAIREDGLVRFIRAEPTVKQMMAMRCAVITTFSSGCPRSGRRTPEERGKSGNADRRTPAAIRALTAG